jgi:deoxyinosine 3'endonuclease (endonuclease V)
MTEHRSTKLMLTHEHPWDVSIERAIAIQRDLRQWVVAQNQLGEVKTVAGVDVSTSGERGRAAIG